MTNNESEIVDYTITPNKTGGSRVQHFGTFADRTIYSQFYEIE